VNRVAGCDYRVSLMTNIRYCKLTKSSFVCYDLCLVCDVTHLAPFASL
jgi:hypothetical protein